MYRETDFIWIKPAKTNGRHMIEAREKAGLSRQELADRVGVKVRQVQRWEKEISKPSATSLEKLNVIFDEGWNR